MKAAVRRGEASRWRLSYLPACNYMPGSALGISLQQPLYGYCPSQIRSRRKCRRQKGLREYKAGNEGPSREGPAGKEGLRTRPWVVRTDRRDSLTVKRHF